MTAWSRSSHVRLVGNQPEQMLLKIKGCHSWQYSDKWSRQSGSVCRTIPVKYLRRDNLDLLPRQAVNKQVKAEPQHDGIDKEADISENDSTSEYGYAGPTHDGACRTNREAPVEHVEDRLRLSIHDKYEKVVLALFQEAQECALDKVHTTIYKVI